MCLFFFKICKKPTEAYGFGHSQNEYSLEEFGKMADQFKLQYFKRPLKVGIWNLGNARFFSPATQFCFFC